MMKNLTKIDELSLNKLFKFGKEEQLIASIRSYIKIGDIKEIKMKKMTADLIDALCYSLVSLRNSGFILTVKTYNSSLDISNVVSFSKDENVSLEGRFKIKKYLRQLPGSDTVNDFSNLLMKVERKSYNYLDSGLLYHEKVIELIRLPLIEEEEEEVEIR